MRKFGKWIGAGLGWTIGGPIGALMGFAFGSLVDAANLEKYEKRQSTTQGDFIVSMLVLIAAAMKADKKVVKSELDFVKIYLIKNFGEEEASEMLLLLRDLLKKEISLYQVGAQIRSKMDYSSRLELLHLVAGIAGTDGTLDVREIEIFEQIASAIGISSNDARSIKSMFVKSTDWAYNVLEINRETSPDEIKKTYRKLALKNHPDRVAYLGEEIRKKAHEKFTQINQAYETVKKEKGIT
jgi:DnaJ like chaperone protein